jgi:hypothetical protein
MPALSKCDIDHRNSKRRRARRKAEISKHDTSFRERERERERSEIVDSCEYQLSTCDFCSQRAADVVVGSSAEIVSASAVSLMLINFNLGIEVNMYLNDVK